MAQSQSTTLDIIKMLFDFLSNNALYITIIILAFLLRNSISNLLNRLSNLIWKSGNSHLSITAYEKDNVVDTTIPQNTQQSEPENKLTDVSILTESSEVEESEKLWFIIVHDFLSKNELTEAEQAFNEHISKQTDSLEIAAARCFYFRMRYFRTCEESIIKSLLNSIENSDDEYVKLKYFSCLCSCYETDNSLPDKINTLKKLIGLFQLKETSNLAKIEIAHCSLVLNDTIAARELLINLINKTTDNETLHSIYKLLSEVEEKDGNIELCCYLLDKSIQYKPADNTQLFESAYKCSNNKQKLIARVNYEKLILLNTTHSAALNNMGVLAQEEKLNSIAHNLYEKSKEQNGTLAMANLGYLYLNAGAIGDAEKIAQIALENPEPHENIYSLLSQIKSTKESEQKKWNELLAAAKEKQAFTRKYIESFYRTDTKITLVGSWVSKNETITISQSDNNVTLTWPEPSNEAGNIMQLSAEVTGSTIKGFYTSKPQNSATTSLLFATRVNIEIIGVINESQSLIEIISNDDNQNFKLTLKKAT